MRRFLTLLFLLCSLLSFGQAKPEGTYCSPPDLYGYCLTFKSGSLFEYNWASCTGAETGRGTYEIENNHLTLHFISDDAPKKSFEIKDANCGSNDQITFTFLIVEEETNEPLPYANISLAGSRDDTPEILSDLNGSATLSLEKTDKETEIKISFLGYKAVSFKINADKCKDIKISLENSFIHRIADGTEREYVIKKSSGNTLTLRQSGTDIRLTRRRR